MLTLSKLTVLCLYVKKCIFNDYSCIREFIGVDYYIIPDVYNFIYSNF